MQKLVLLLGVAFACHFTVQAGPESPRFGKDDDDYYYYAKTITGTVKDTKGQPLSGATVSVKGGTQTTVTNASGFFSLSVADDATTLIVSYVGADTREVTIGTSNNLDVQLTTTDNVMSDVVVVGYGTQRRTNVTGSVATVDSKTLLQRPAPNAANLLQGRVPGLQVTQPSGEPGRDNPNILIRGRSTFGGSTAPLVLIDGVTGSLNNLSPDDIESATVLKDAASAAIYGSRSANGVILITTKKGRRGQTTFSYRANTSWYTPTALPDFITSSAEYMTMFNTAAARSGVAFRYPQADIDKYANGSNPAQYPNFNTVDYWFKTALATNHNLSLSGGTDRSTFNVSLSYLNQDAMLPGYSFKRYNGLLNYTNQVSKAITVGTNMIFTYKDRQEPPFTSENMALLVYAAGPLYGPFLPDGSGRVVSRAYEGEGRNRNPQEALAMGWQNTKEYNLNAQAYIDIKLFKGLTWTSKAAINYVDEYYKMYQHPYSAYLLQERDATGDYKMSSFGPDYLGVTDQYSKTLNPTIYSVLNYDTKIGSDHSIKALLGFEQLYNKFQTLRARRLNGVSTALTELVGYNSTGEAINATYPRLPGLNNPFEWALQSYFGRLNYAYKGKYLIEGNARFDGTSKVSPEYRWGFFPSVSVGWLASQENFIRDNVNWISELKLRGSYGTLGNQDIGTYLYQNVLTVSGVSYPFGNTAATPGAVLNSFKDQSLQWETTYTTDFGLDMDIKRGLFGITFDWFNRKTTGILAAQPLPASVGLNASTFNNGSMQSRGIEVELRHQYTVGKFTYGVNAQLSTAKNKVLDIKVPSIGTSIRQNGLPLDAHYLYIWDGIFQESDINNPKVPRHVLNPTPKAGDLKMKDLNGDGVVDANDRTVVKGAYPNYIYSFGLNASYKGIGLNVFFQGVEGVANRVNNWGVDPFMQGTPPTTKWRNAWTPQNPTNELPAIYTAGYTGVANYAGSTYYLMNASYLRLKNVVLSYAFPRAIYSRIKAKDLSVYVSADNLVTFTSYEGSDPERSSTTGNFVQYPQARIFNLGLNIKF